LISGVLNGEDRRGGDVVWLGRRAGLGLFSGFFLIWVIMSYPASLQAWWFMDDYNSYDPLFSAWKFIESGIYNGRLLLGPVLMPLLLDAPPEGNGINVLHRLVQMALHAWAGVLMVSLLARRLPMAGAVACAAVFTFYCFHGQPTMWLAAAIYPAGAVLSLSGVRFIVGTVTWKWRLLGAFCLFLAMHTSQVAAITGLLVYGIGVVLAWVEDGQLDWKALTKRVGWMGAGLLTGFLGNFVLMRISGHLRVYERGWDERMAFVGRYLEAFMHGFEGYTAAVATGHWMVIGVFLAAVGTGLFIWRRRVLPLGAALLLPAALGVGALSPLVATGSLFPSFRVFYLLPLILTGALAVVFLAGKQVPLFRYAGWILSLWLLFSYFGPARQNASDLVTLYQRDRATYAALEAVAVKAGTERVLFMDWPGAGGWDLNPYDLTVVMGDNLKSVLHIGTSNYRALWYFTGLENVDWWHWEEMRRKYAPLAAGLPRDEPFKFVHIEEEDFLLVVPR
jgi:hypothetical protein